MHISPRSLIEQVRLDHGPRDLLARYLLLADRRLQELGLRARLRTDFETLAEVNEQNRSSWPDLIHTLDPRHSILRLDSSYWLEVITAEGEPVAIHSGRLFDWPDTTLDEEVRSLRVFYADPAPHLARGEYARGDEPRGRARTGLNMFGGAVWVHPEHRAQGLGGLVTRVSRAYGYTRWAPSFFWMVTEPKTFGGGFIRATGPFEIVQKLRTRLEWRGELDLLLMAMDADAFLQDLARQLDQATRESSLRMETQSIQRSPPAPDKGISSRS